MRGYRRRRSGMSLLEVLIAMLIIGVSIASMLSLWYFAYNMSYQSDIKCVGYNIGRRTIERFREATWNVVPEGASCLFNPANGQYVATLYYDGSGGGESTTQGTSQYKVTAVVTTDKWTTDTPPVIAGDALRAVDVTVTRLADSSVVFRTGTYLVRSGI